MPPPTTAIYLNSTTPAAPPGNQNVTFQSDGGQPSQDITAYPQLAVAPAGGVAGLLGVSMPDGLTIGIKPDGTLYVIATAGGGGGGGGTSASGGAYVCVVPQGAKDGSNTQYTIPAPVLAGTAYWLVRNDAMQRQLGPKAYYAVQGTTITLATPLRSDDYIEFYYVMGTPNSGTGGGGGVTPVPLSLRGTSTGAGASGSSFAVSFPSGTQVGDLVVIVCNHDFNLSVPSGWTNQDLHNGTTWNAMTISKVMTSGDISTGSVTISAGGSQDWTYIAAAFIGPTSGIREVDVISMFGGVQPATITTSGAVIATDMALYFATGRQTGTTLAISRGIAVTAITGANSQANLNSEVLTASGAYATNFTFTLAGNGTYFVVVIVKQ